MTRTQDDTPSLSDQGADYRRDIACQNDEDGTGRTKSAAAKAAPATADDNVQVMLARILDNQAQGRQSPQLGFSEMRRHLERHDQRMGALESTLESRFSRKEIRMTDLEATAKKRMDYMEEKLAQLERDQTEQKHRHTRPESTPGSLPPLSVACPEIPKATTSISSYDEAWCKTRSASFASAGRSRGHRPAIGGSTRCGFWARQTSSVAPRSEMDDTY